MHSEKLNVNSSIIRNEANTKLSFLISGTELCEATFQNRRLSFSQRKGVREHGNITQSLILRMSVAGFSSMY